MAVVGAPEGTRSSGSSSWAWEAIGEDVENS